MIYTFSGNQLPAIDNKKTLKKMTKCAEVMGEEGGGGGSPWSYERNLQKASKGFLLCYFQCLNCSNAL